MANGDDLSPPGTPAWIKLIVAILKTSGPSVLIALILIWFMMANVSESLSVLHSTMTAADTKMAAFAAEQRAFNARRELQLDVQLRIMRQVCANGAKNEAALKTCME